MRLALSGVGEELPTLPPKTLREIRPVSGYDFAL